MKPRNFPARHLARHLAAKRRLVRGPFETHTRHSIPTEELALARATQTKKHRA